MSSSSRAAVRVRAAFLSDLHLGARECQAEEIASFLRTVQMKQLFLVGDIVDLWNMRRGIYWPAAHHEVLRLILDKARNGTRVIYVPGNHDDLARALCSSVIAGIEVHEEYVHTTRKGQRLLVIHGDAFDGAVRFSPLLKATGSALYTVVLIAGLYVNAVRRLLRMPRWSLATWIKSQVGNATEYVQRFELAAARAAAERGLDGVVCGHIHRPQVTRINGVLYCNDGDWVEHCTALIEDRNGELRLWEYRQQDLAAEPLPQAVRDAA
jgi:UDP-2,3-diacylglucosamine pyrophosphatase LpxH